LCRGVKDKRIFNRTTSSKIILDLSDGLIFVVRYKQCSLYPNILHDGIETCELELPHLRYT